MTLSVSFLSVMVWVAKNGVTMVSQEFINYAVVGDGAASPLSRVEIGLANINQDDQWSSSSSYPPTNKHILLQVQKK